MTTRARNGQDFWEGHVQEWSKSGQTQVEYCERTGISVKTFHRWKSRLRDTAVRKDPVAPPLQQDRSLIPVRLAAPVSATTGLEGVREIRIRRDGGQWVAEIPSTVDYTHLVTVLKAIAGAHQ